MGCPKYTSDTMIKILFLHNTAMWYRTPFFRELTKLYKVKFVFTKMETIRKIRFVEVSDVVKELHGLNYKIIRNYWGIPIGLFKEMTSDSYDIIIDSLESPIKTALTFTFSKIMRKPILFWSEEWCWNKNDSINKLRSPFLKFLVSHSDGILVPGTIHKKYFISLGALPENIFIVPNASNISVKETDKLNREILNEKIGAKNKKVILYVGRLKKRKGIEYLIKAFAKLKGDSQDIVLIIVGRGESDDELKALSKTLGIGDSVYFAGYVEDELLPAFYLLCNICVVPSITYGMGDPWVFIVNEAMYFGKPLIATDAVGAAFDMILNGKNGFMVPEKDVDALYQSMNYILADPELEREMGIKSKEIIEQKYLYENMINGLNEAIECTIKKRQI
ncbi:hypothetical protein DU74_02225 [Methanosarcina mazei]|uniref:Glycosyl transferase family 1 domain-containing protein n=1 Tax=Methanosarcina mazei TaxID=2209 RepID=A0A0F8P9K2_METMZ|nr:glycosyltransferase family 4 protein [Methanosarcina mazei]KKH59373.1 hypothetical protein DU74_02225 [Methanosarcina mazei]